MTAVKEQMNRNAIGSVRIIIFKSLKAANISFGEKEAEDGRSNNKFGD